MMKTIQTSKMWLENILGHPTSSAYINYNNPKNSSSINDAAYKPVKKNINHMNTKDIKLGEKYYIQTEESGYYDKRRVSVYKVVGYSETTYQYVVETDKTNNGYWLINSEQIIAPVNVKEQSEQTPKRPWWKKVLRIK